MVKRGQMKSLLNCNGILIGLIFLGTSNYAARECCGDVIYNYTGLEFTITGSSPLISGSGIVFSSSDFITGTAIFENVGDTIAKQVTLTTTGTPGFSITFDNTQSSLLEGFVWSGNNIEDWNLSFVQNRVGDPSFNERIEISKALGDLVSFDEGGDNFDGAFNFHTGTSFGRWSAVPEPSNCLVLLSALAFACQRRSRKSAKLLK